MEAAPSPEFERVVRLILEAKGIQLRTEIEVLEWLDNEIGVLEHACVYNQGLFSNDSPVSSKLVIDVRILNIVLSTMQKFQKEYSIQEEQERNADRQRLKAIDAGLKNLHKMENRISVCDKLIAISQAMSAATDKGLVRIGEVREMLQAVVEDRIGEESKLGRFTSLFEMLRHHPMASHCQRLSDVADPKNLFDLSRLANSKSNIEDKSYGHVSFGFSTTKLASTSELLMLCCCTILYFQLEATYLEHLRQHSESIGKEKSSKEAILKTVEMADSFCSFAEISWPYRDAVVGMWLVDIGLEIEMSIELLSHVNLEVLFPSTNLTDFHIMNLMVVRSSQKLHPADNFGRKQAESFKQFSLMYYRLRGLDIIPRSVENAICMVDVLLSNGFWEEAISLQRRLGSQLHITNGDATGEGKSSLRVALLQRIFDWIVCLVAKQKVEKKLGVSSSDDPSESSMAQKLVRYPFTPKEQDDLENFLSDVISRDDFSSAWMHNSMNLNLDMFRETVKESAHDLLLAFNLLHYRVKAAVDLHGRSQQANGEREALLRNHERTLLPYGISRGSPFATMVGTLIETLPKTRVQFGDGGKGIPFSNEQGAKGTKVTPDTGGLVQNVSKDSKQNNFGKKILHIQRNSVMKSMEI